MAVWRSLPPLCFSLSLTHTGPACLIVSLGASWDVGTRMSVLLVQDAMRDPFRTTDNFPCDTTFGKRAA